MTLSTQASRALTKALGARSRKVRASRKFKQATLLMARVLLQELRKSGKKYPRSIDRALRGA